MLYNIRVRHDCPTNTTGPLIAWASPEGRYWTHINVGTWSKKCAEDIANQWRKMGNGWSAEVVPVDSDE